MFIYPWDLGSGFGGLEDFLLRKEKRLHAIPRGDTAVQQAHLGCANAILARE